MLDVGPPPAGLHHHWTYWRILRTYYVRQKTSKEHPRIDYGHTTQPIGSPRAPNYMWSHHKTSQEYPRTDYGHTAQPIGSPRAQNYMWSWQNLVRASQD